MSADLSFLDSRSLTVIKHKEVLTTAASYSNIPRMFTLGILQSTPVVLHSVPYVMNVVRDKRLKFIELAEARVARAIGLIRLIGNLSNRNNYEFSDSDSTKIIAALESEIRILRLKFKLDGSKQKTGFKL
jgi:hypothetical protein